MEFVPARHDIVRSITHLWLIKCWRMLQGSNNRIPLWKDLELKDVASLVDKLMFSDVVRTGDDLRFRIRYQGSRITELYGADCRGKFLGTGVQPALRDAMIRTYRHTVHARCPTYTVLKTFDRDLNAVSYERLLLPFSFDGHRVSRILTALEVLSPEGKFARDGMMIAPPAVEHVVCATIQTVPS
ncbi:MAG: PAS domain-containing protein [Variibacter sp.]|nr:PAS domain-containing protein [Variibacter sp.]